MRERKFVVGETPESKFASIERVFQHMSTRMHKNVAIVIPPIPISFVVGTVKENGELFRYFFPAGSYIRQIFLFVEEVKKDTKPSLIIDAVYRLDGQRFTFPYKAGLNTLERELFFEAGTMIKVSTTEPAAVSGIWFACLYDIVMGACCIKQLAIDSIIGTLEDLHATETEEGTT